jgi:hypothetical protein
MNTRSMLAVGVCLAGVLGIGIGTRTADAQSGDLIKVTLPYATTVRTVTLPAGECTISEMWSDGNGTLLLIRSSSGPGVEALVSRIAAPQSKPSETQVVLRHTGATYQMDKIWLAGRDYGYELLPASAH